MLFDNLPIFIRSSDGDLCHEASVMGGVERRSSFTCWMGKVKLYEPCQIGTEALQVMCMRLCSVRCHFEKHPNHPRVEDFRQAGGRITTDACELIVEATVNDDVLPRPH